MPRSCLGIFLSLSHVILKAGITSPFTDEKNRLRYLKPGHPSLCSQTSLIPRSKCHLICQWCSDLHLQPWPSSWQCGGCFSVLILFGLSAAFVSIHQGLFPHVHGTMLSSFTSCLSLSGPEWVLHCPSLSAFPELGCFPHTQLYSLTGSSCVTSWL